MTLAQKGGFVYFTGDPINELTVTRGTYVGSVVGLSGGFLDATGGVVRLVDVTTDGTVAELDNGGKGGAIALWGGATAEVTGGSYANASAAYGGVVYGQDAFVTVSGISAFQPEGTLDGAIAFAERGSLTVFNLSATPTDTSRSAIHSDEAAVVLTDVSIQDAVAAVGAIDGTISIHDAPSATLTRLRLCNLTGRLGGAGLTVRGGTATLRSSLVWNSAAIGGAVQVHGDGTLNIEHTTFWNNAGTAIEVGATGVANVTHSLFAGQTDGAVAVTVIPNGALEGGPNYLETGSLAGDLLGLMPTTGEVMFQATTRDPWLEVTGAPVDYGCDADFWVHWDSPTVDWASANGPAADVDGTAPDMGRYGGPEGWPKLEEELWDPDGDKDRADLDCDSADGDQFPRNDADGDCRCDSDHDGYDDAGCKTEPRATAVDCNDGDSTSSPDAEEILGDGLDNDCDGTIDEEGDLGEPGDPDEGIVGNPEFGLIFGGGGCQSAGGNAGLGWLVGLAALARRRAR